MGQTRGGRGGRASDARHKEGEGGPVMSDTRGREREVEEGE